MRRVRRCPVSGAAERAATWPMTGQVQFGLIVLVIGLAGTAAVLSNRLSARLRVPAPAFFLVAAVIAAQLWPAAAALPVTTVERVVTVALAIILFDGGMHIGRRRFRTAAGGHRLDRDRRARWSPPRAPRWPRGTWRA